MKKFPLLAVICSALLIGTAQAAKADELDFTLANPRPEITAQVESNSPITGENPAIPNSPVPATEPAGQTDTPAEAVLLDRASVALVSQVSGTLGTPLPETTAPADQVSVAVSDNAPAEPPPIAEEPIVQPIAAEPQPRSVHQSVELQFDLQSSALAEAAPPADKISTQEGTPLKSTATTVAIATQPLPENPETLFEGGADSLVARTVGHAEGTRTAAGQKTDAYYGHLDPGNARWNLGSFSYQHCDKTCTPEDADERQLARLKRQTEVIQKRAEVHHLTLTLEEALNGIDLANQAPLAALAQGGYIDWLKAAHQRGLTGSDAVLWARTWSFLNPQTQTWDAPGLGNRYDSISHDQDRRLSAIARALANYHSRQK